MNLGIWRMNRFCFQFFFYHLISSFWDWKKKKTCEYRNTNVGILKLKKLEQNKKKVTGVTGACFWEKIEQRTQRRKCLALGFFPSSLCYRESYRQDFEKLKMFFCLNLKVEAIFSIDKFQLANFSNFNLVKVFLCRNTFSNLF